MNAEIEELVSIQVLYSKRPSNKYIYIYKIPPLSPYWVVFFPSSKFRSWTRGLGALGFCAVYSLFLLLRSSGHCSQMLFLNCLSHCPSWGVTALSTPITAWTPVAFTFYIFSSSSLSLWYFFQLLVFLFLYVAVIWYCYIYQNCLLLLFVDHHDVRLVNHLNILTISSVWIWKSHTSSYSTYASTWLHLLQTWNQLCRWCTALHFTIFSTTVWTSMMLGKSNIVMPCNLCLVVEHVHAFVISKSNHCKT